MAQRWRKKTGFGWFFISVSCRGGPKQKRANANKCSQTLTNASKRRGENASKRKQTRANVANANKCLHPPLLRFFCAPFAICLLFPFLAIFAPFSSFRGTSHGWHHLRPSLKSDNYRVPAKKKFESIEHFGCAILTLFLRYFNF